MQSWGGSGGSLAAVIPLEGDILLYVPLKFAVTLSAYEPHVDELLNDIDVYDELIEFVQTFTEEFSD